MKQAMLWLLIAAIAFPNAFGHQTDPQITERVFMEMTIGGKDIGHIVIGLFGNTVPRTVTNFAAICEVGIDGKSYNGSVFHRVIDGFIIQGGDIINGDGTGRVSIYGPKFEDENFDVKHSGPGYLSMANSGKHTNGCQFFILTVAAPWLDDRHVVFGKVIEGYDSVVKKIEETETDPATDRPIKRVAIKSCGLLSGEHYS